MARPSGRSAACDVHGPTVRLEYARGCADLSVRLDDSHPLAPRISHSAVPVYVAAVAAGLLIAEFVGFLGSGRQTRIVLFDLDHLQAEIDGPAQK